MDFVWLLNGFEMDARIDFNLVFEWNLNGFHF